MEQSSQVEVNNFIDCLRFFVHLIKKFNDLQYQFILILQW